MEASLNYSLKRTTKGVLATLLRFLFNLIYISLSLGETIECGNSVFHKQTNNSSKGKAFKSCFVVGYLFVVFVYLRVFKTGSHYIAGLKLTAT